MDTNATDRQEGKEPVTGEALAVLVFITVASIITCPLTTILNVLIIICVKTKSALRTQSNITLACLAITDVVMGAIGQPVFISWLIARGQGDDAPWQTLLCQFIFKLLTLSSLLHMVMINLERYIAIKHTLQYITIVTEVRLIYLSVFLWIMALVLTLLTSFFNITKIISVITPLAIIVFCQAVLYREARRHEKEIANQQVSVEVKQRKLKEKKALKTTTTILFFLMLSYLPLLFAGLLIKTEVVKSVNLRDILTFTVILSITANSLVNPIIYCVRQRQFRVAFIELIFGKTHTQAEDIEKRAFRVLNRVAPLENEQSQCRTGNWE